MVNINPAYKKSELEYCIRKVGLKSLIFATQFKTSSYKDIVRELIPELVKQRKEALKLVGLPSLKSLIQISSQPINGVFSFREIQEKGRSSSKSRLNAISSSLRPKDPINIQFTSGTTGAPKGATLTHRNIINNALSCARAMRLSD